MRSILLSALALGAMTTVALAGPAQLTGAGSGPAVLTTAQMDSVKAGAPPKNVQKQQAKQGDYPFGQRNAGKCPNHGQCK